MADNNSSSNVASVAIVVILILAGLGVWYFITHGGLKNVGTTETTKVEVSVPATDTTAPAKK